MGNGSRLSIYINAGLKGKGFNMPMLNDDICLMIWDYINLYMMYTNGYKKGEFCVPTGKKFRYCDLESELGLSLDRRSNSDRIITGTGPDEITRLKRLPKDHKILPIFGHIPLCQKKFFNLKLEVNPHFYSAWDTSRLFYKVPLYNLGHGSGYYFKAVTPYHIHKVMNLVKKWNETIDCIRAGDPIFDIHYRLREGVDVLVTSEQERQYFSQAEVHGYYINKLNSMYNRLVTEALFMQTKVFSAMEKDSFLHVHNKNCFCRRSKIIALTYGPSEIILHIHSMGNYAYGGIHKKGHFKYLSHTNFEY